jgi:hypothetical protein
MMNKFEVICRIPLHTVFYQHLFGKYGSENLIRKYLMMHISLGGFITQEIEKKIF